MVSLIWNNNRCFDEHTMCEGPGQNNKESMPKSRKATLDNLTTAARRARRIRENETPWEREQRLYRDRLRHEYHRNTETAEARDARLARDRERHALQRHNESPRRRAARLARERERKREQRRALTPDQRQTIRTIQRERQWHRRHHQKPTAFRNPEEGSSCSAKEDTKSPLTAGPPPAWTIVHCTGGGGIAPAFWPFPNGCGGAPGDLLQRFAPQPPPTTVSRVLCGTDVRRTRADAGGIMCESVPETPSDVIVENRERLSVREQAASSS